MASTYSTNLKIELIGSGEQSGSWGDTTNANLGTALEQAIVGTGTAVFASDADLTLSLANSNAAQAARAIVLAVTSGVSLTTTRNLVVPTINKPYVVANNTTGGQSIVVKTAAGTGVTVPNGARMWVYADGTNVVQMQTKHSVDLGNVDNTSDANKPISTATQTALNAKEGTVAAGTTAQYWRGDKSWQDLFSQVRAATLTGLSTATNAAITAADTVLAALGKVQAQITAHFGAGGAAHANATTSVAGFMTAADKLKLDGISPGAGGTVTSVAASVPAFLSVAGSPITTSGTLAISYSGTALPVANGGTGGTTAAAARTSLGLGTAATVNTGTSGATIPLLNAANTWGSRQSISKTNTVTVGGSSLSDQLEIANGGSGSAIMTFHRNGEYAINMGLDTDNVWRLGGWSNGTNTYRLASDTSGNLAVQGVVTAPEVTLASTFPVLNMRDSDATAGNKNARLAWNAGSLYFERINDALNAVTSTPLQIDASGNVYVPQLRFTASGNVMGTTANTASLSMQAGDSTTGNFAANGAAIALRGSAGGFNPNGFELYAGGVECFRIDATGLGTFRNSTGFGYGAGSGGTVTQATSKSTAVTLNKPSGSIVTNNSTLLAGESAQFQVNNSTVAATSGIVVNCVNFSSRYRVDAGQAVSGSFFIRLTNLETFSVADAVTIQFIVFNGSTS